MRRKETERRVVGGERTVKVKLEGLLVADGAEIANGAAHGALKTQLVGLVVLLGKVFLRLAELARLAVDGAELAGDLDTGGASARASASLNVLAALA